jgi:hypothetical protein
LAGPNAEAMEANRRNAAKWAAWAALHMGVSPVADWIVLSSVLSEEHRDLGLRCDKALIERCDELWLTGGRVSEGMGIERDYALAKFKAIRDLTPWGFDAPAERRTLPPLAWPWGRHV